jgi:glycosyltransferase involved in cell wall biosynthesis
MPPLHERPAGAPPRLAILSYYSSAEFDARAQRIARSAADAGWHVTIYARWSLGLPEVVEGPGYRIVRVATDIRLAFPWLRGPARRRLMARMRAARAAASAAAGSDSAAGSDPATISPSPPRVRTLDPLDRLPRRLRGTALSPLFRGLKQRWRELPATFEWLMNFPIRPMAWAVALEQAVEPHDLWHGMWAGSLPSLDRLRRRFGGRTVYDSRDIYLHSRQFDRMDRFRRGSLLRIERRWAHSADAVVTVNDAYADILARTLRIPRPAVVMNCPVRWTRPDPPPDRIRAVLGLPKTTAVALYQGALKTERGIEQAMDAILEVPDAVLVLLVYGDLRRWLTTRAAEPPYAGHVYLLPPVPPSELLDWTASSDVMVMAIQPTTLNHRYTTPQKLFEAIAAGVPVVASDLPGMAEIVQATGAGILCDGTSPRSIATAIRSILEEPPAGRAAIGARAREAAAETYNWDRQVAVLFGVYERLLDRSPLSSDAERAPYVHRRIRD